MGSTVPTPEHSSIVGNCRSQLIVVYVVVVVVVNVNVTCHIGALKTTVVFVICNKFNCISNIPIIMQRANMDTKNANRH